MSDEIVTACPCCGAYNQFALAKPPALLAVCDVLVVRALEQVGKRIVRVERGRFSQMNGRPWHLAHTVWGLEDVWLEKAMHGAWDVVPAMLDSHGCCGVTAKQVTAMLDEYVRRLVRTRIAHNLPALKVAFEETLGIEVGEPVPYVG
jgi:hypothetical protein